MLRTCPAYTIHTFIFGFKGILAMPYHKFPLSLPYYFTKLIPLLDLYSSAFLFTGLFTFFIVFNFFIVLEKELLTFP